MNIGNLDPDVEAFLKNYKQYGYSTRTQLITDALKTLKRQKAREWREKYRDELLAEYAQTQPEHVWEFLDGEDFEEN